MSVSLADHSGRKRDRLVARQVAPRPNGGDHFDDRIVTGRTVARLDRSQLRREHGAKASPLAMVPS
jgi:hypothetical protein